jgi:hypothetical protein
MRDGYIIIIIIVQLIQERARVIDHITIHYVSTRILEQYIPIHA